ncbi:hypothetical protein J4437_05155 [Candidatus Woesearchaeota archaeon]|nr:hypothetical protein [Candidatus Woesearchaeota archaeon]
MPPVTGKILGVQRKAAERSEHATFLFDNIGDYEGIEMFNKNNNFIFH